MTRQTRRILQLAMAFGAAVPPLLAAPALAQTSVDNGPTARASRDSVLRLERVAVTGSRPVGSVAALPDVRGAMLFTGKKTQVLLLDSLTANRAQNVSREVLGRVPGANFSETEGAGFPANGIGLRGLDPVQSVEMNVRQDGVGIAADVYGYPETYYLPPLEAVSRVEVVRGSGSLQFGPQVGGVIDYVLREGEPDTPLRVSASQTVGSYGLSTTYGDLVGGTGGWTYFAFAQGRLQNGSRPNGDLRQLSAAARLGYDVSPTLRLATDVSLLRNRIHMAGGLGNAAFNADARQSLRARNWLTSPWNVAALSADWRPSATTRLVTTLSAMASGRDLVWRSEDGGAEAADDLDPATGTYVPREVEVERFRNVTVESRLLTSYGAFGRFHTLAVGARAFTGSLRRDEGGEGTTGSAYDLRIAPGTDFPERFRFTSRNAALFAENAFRFTDRLTITPGVRAEWLRSAGDGVADSVSMAFPPSARAFALGGVGLQYATSSTTNLYANVTQAYRPVEYSALVPFGSAVRVAPRLTDPRARSADVGLRGTWRDLVTFDVAAFHLLYRDRIGLVTTVDSNGTVAVERRNVATSRHRGLESFVELRPLNRLLGLSDAVTAALGAFGAYSSLALVDARYTEGDFEGNRVEYAPRLINRVGLTWTRRRVESTLQVSTVGAQYGDANNTVASFDSNVGRVPAYQLVDWSGRWRLGERYALSFGVNNVGDVAYFTRRTGEYPGPGILPGQGRSVYLGVAVASPVAEGAR